MHHVLPAHGRRAALSVATALLLTSCTGEAPPDAGDAAFHTAEVDCEELPPGSRLPRFGTDGRRLLLSFVSTDEAGGHHLLYRELTGTAWTADREVAAGEDWFVNWADFPSVKPLGDSLFYHYLAYAGSGTYDYDIRYGNGEGAAGVLHNDGVAAEHGFVSSAHLPDGDLRVSWLDGRHSKGDGSHTGEGHDHGDSGAMSLRTAVLTPDGEVRGRTELDPRVCDCCTTATAATDDLTLVAYRDRSEAEVRDISFVVRTTDGAWSEPQPVHADGWQITGCPVNGPAVAANAAGDIGIAWYTAAGGRPRIQFARYQPGSTSFGEPVLLDEENPLGRVDTKLAEDGTAYVLGLAAGPGAELARLTLWTITPAGQVTSRVVAETEAARSVGFPRLALHTGRLLVAYTRVAVGEQPARVELCTLYP